MNGTLKDGEKESNDYICIKRFPQLEFPTEIVAGHYLKAVVIVARRDSHVSDPLFAAYSDIQGIFCWPIFINQQELRVDSYGINFNKSITRLIKGHD